MSCKNCPDIPGWINIFRLKNGTEIIGKNAWEDYNRPLIPDKIRKAFDDLTKDLTVGQTLDLMKDGNPIKANQAFIDYQKALHLATEKINSILEKEYVKPCECVSLNSIKSFLFKDQEEPIDKRFMEKLLNMKKISEQAFKLSQRKIDSMYIQGMTGTGKTAILKFLYNKIVMKEKSRTRVLYTGEDELFVNILDHDEAFDKFLAELKIKDFIFIDEFLSRRNWIDQGNTDREKPNMRRKRFFQIVDYIYDFNLYAKVPKVLIFASENLPDEIIKETNLVRRISESIKGNEIKLK